MRGKRVDNEFISEFIADCIRSGINTPEDIMSVAQRDINEIDEAIKRVEKDKIRRSKLLDVINAFQAKAEKSTTEASALPYFNMKYPNVCQFICETLKQGPVSINEIKGNYTTSDIIFCVKQLLENKIISKSGPYLIRGNNFNDYMKNAFKETL